MRDTVSAGDFEPIQILQKQSSFVVRIYSPGNNPGSVAHWFGTIEHVQSLDRLAFQKIEDMVKFIARHGDINLAPPGRPGPSSRWHVPDLRAFLNRRKPGK